jgi:hypothetical protein
MTLRGIFLTFYCLFLALGTWWIVRQQKLAVPEFVASRDLQLDHWLREGDVKSASWVAEKVAALANGPNPNSFVGRYVTGDVPKGATLRLEATSAVPLMAPRDGHLTLLVTLPRARLGTLNAASCVQLSARDSKPFGVRAILCPLSDVADCSAAIDVPLERLSEIGKPTSETGKPPATLTVNAEAPCP